MKFEFNTRIKIFQELRNPNTQLQYCLEYFCNILNAIHSLEPLKLTSAFCKFILEKIFKGNELTSKYEYFNWSLLYGLKDNVDNTNSNPEENNVDDADKDDENEEVFENTIDDTDFGDGDEEDSNNMRIENDLAI
jgi:hypothetical protein